MLSAFFAILLWSTLAYLIVSLAAIPPFLLLGAALVIGSLSGIARVKTWKVPAKTLAIGIFGIFGYHLCLFLSFRIAPPVEANLINYLWPLLIVVLSPAFFKEYKLAVKHKIAALLGFAGAFLIVSNGRLQFQSEYLAGYILAFAAALIWAVYSLSTKKLPAFSISAAGLFCLISGICCLAVHILIEKPYSLQIAELPYLALLGLGPLGFAFILWDMALKQGDPRVVGSMAYLTPLLSTLVLTVSGKGTFTLLTLIAMALIIGGAVISSLPAKAIRPGDGDRQEKSR